MEMVDELIQKLGHALNIEPINTGGLENLVNILIANKAINIRILDFEYYNKDRLQHTKNEKLRT